MKKLLKTKLPVTILIMGLTGLLALNCSKQVPEENKLSVQNVSQTVASDKNTDKEKSCCAEDIKSVHYCDNSVYQLNSKWNNEMNRQVKLGDYKGHKVVMSMIFASCTYACPLIVNDMRKIEALVPEKERDNVKFLLVSIDPERDTPEALLDYSRRQNLNLSRWELLTGSKSDIRSLAALLGFKYKKNDDGDYVHSNLISVFNREGEIVYQHEGLNKDIGDVVKELKAIN